MAFKKNFANRDRALQEKALHNALDRRQFPDLVTSEAKPINCRMVDHPRTDVSTTEIAARDNTGPLVLILTGRRRLTHEDRERLSNVLQTLNQQKETRDDNNSVDPLEGVQTQAEGQWGKVVRGSFQPDSSMQTKTAFNRAFCVATMEITPPVGEAVRLGEKINPMVQIDASEPTKTTQKNPGFER